MASDPIAHAVLDLLRAADPDAAGVLERESARQDSTIELIASENHVSAPVMHAMGTCLTNKYAEGYPGARYYGGCEFHDEAETLARDPRQAPLRLRVRQRPAPTPAPRPTPPRSSRCSPPATPSPRSSLADGGAPLPRPQGQHERQVVQRGPLPAALRRGPPRLRAHRLRRRRGPSASSTSPSSSCAATRPTRARSTSRASARSPTSAARCCSPTSRTSPGSSPRASTPRPSRTATSSPPPPTRPSAARAAGSSSPTTRRIAKKIDRAVFPGMQGGPLMHVVLAKAVAFGEALRPEFRAYCERVVANRPGPRLRPRRARLPHHLPAAPTTTSCSSTCAPRDAELTGADGRDLARAGRHHHQQERRPPGPPPAQGHQRPAARHARRHHPGPRRRGDGRPRRLDRHRPDLPGRRRHARPRPPGGPVPLRPLPAADRRRGRGGRLTRARAPGGPAPERGYPPGMTTHASASPSVPPRRPRRARPRRAGVPRPGRTGRRGHVAAQRPAARAHEERVRRRALARVAGEPDEVGAARRLRRVGLLRLGPTAW